MIKNNIYNRTYVFLILKNSQLPLFVNRGKLFIPVFTEFEEACSFKEKYAPNNTVLKVITPLAISFLNDILSENDYIPLIRLNDNNSEYFKSKQFISCFYNYKDENNLLLNTMLQKDKSEEEILNILIDSSFYVLITNEIKQDNICKAIFDNCGILLDVGSVTSKEVPSLTVNKNNLIIFTSIEGFEKDNNCDFKKYYSLAQLKSDIHIANLKVDFLSINLPTKNIKVSIDKLTDI